jgi:hypothetical protein
VALAGIARSPADAVMAQIVSHRLLRVGVDTKSSHTGGDTAVTGDPITSGRKHPTLEQFLNQNPTFQWLEVDVKVAVRDFVRE